MDEEAFSEREAFDWVRREYRLSMGAAQAALKAAVDSGNVRLFDQVTTVSADGQVKRNPATISDLVTERFVHDLRINADDLRWQVEQQLGRPRSQRRQKPNQQELNRVLVDLARERGSKLKQGDGDARALLIGRGATVRQVNEAFRSLPEEYKYTRGKPSSK